MTIHRAPGLQRFLDATREAIVAQAPSPGSAARLAERIFGALGRAAPEAGVASPSRLPACLHLADALAEARASSPSVARVADAFAAIEPALPWKRRPNAKAAGNLFADNHANAVIVGPDGLEPRDDVLMGVSLMAPKLQYPDHRHPPEEIYLVLSKGQWRQGEGPWHEPGPGRVVFNPSNVVHAMRSTDRSLLAIWCLWTAQTPMASGSDD
jgi:quercetin dioxygenase-like cupin family protein